MLKTVWNRDKTTKMSWEILLQSKFPTQLVKIWMRCPYQHNEPQEIHFNDEITQFSSLSTTTRCHCLICYCVMMMISSCGFRRRIITICQHRNYQFRKEMAKQSSVRQEERCEGVQCTMYMSSKWIRFLVNGKRNAYVRCVCVCPRK